MTKGSAFFRGRKERRLRKQIKGFPNLERRDGEKGPILTNLVK